MYKELSKDEDFSKSYSTWIIAYCLDTNSFFATNQRHFFWEYDIEFSCENDAISYFKTHLDEFLEIRNGILSSTGGWNTNSDLYFENLRESFKIRSGKIMEELLHKVEELNANVPDGIVKDADTILVDMVQENDFEITGIAQDIFNIWKNSLDKKAVEQMFFEFTDMEFKDFLEKCKEEITR